MAISPNSVKTKYELLKNTFQNQAFFKINDAAQVLNMPKSSIYWYLSKMVDQEYITRVSNGKFTIHQSNNQDNIIASQVATQIQNLLQETGFQYYISGIDVLINYMQHIPDAYPIMLYVDKYSRDEIEDILLKANITVISAKELINKTTISNLNRLNTLVLLYETQNFAFSKNGYATREKAFVDLYFEVTRHEYPLPLQELSRIYKHLYLKGAIDMTKLAQAAHEHSIRPEIRMIIDIEKIHPAALELAKMIKGDLNND